MNNQDYNFWFWLSVIANICQIESYEMLKEEISNNDLMAELQEQDTNYLQKIILQNEQIIKLLTEGR